MSASNKVPIGSLGDGYREVIGPKELAQILNKSVKTVYAWIAAGRLKGCCRKRGKHVLIHRASALDRIFNGPNWA